MSNEDIVREMCKLAFPDTKFIEEFLILDEAVLEDLTEDKQEELENVA